MVKTSRVLLLMAGAAILALLGAATLAPAQTDARDRITQKIEGSEAAVVTGNVSPLARAEFDRGRVAGDMLIPHAAIVFRLSPAQQRDLDKLLAAQQDTTSPNYHKWLTPEQYADRFGMTPNDVAKVITWLKARGLQVEGPSHGRTFIFFSGTAAQIENAFQTEFHRYTVHGESHFANATEPSAPAAFAGMVLAFHNFNDFRPKSRVRSAPHYTNGQTPPQHFLAPEDFATIYDLGPLYTAGLDGTGVTIAVVGDSAISQSDINAFRSASGLPAVTVTQMIVPGSGTPTHNGDEGEADLDLEWSGAVAKGANLIYVVAGPNDSGGASDALLFALDHDVAPVISNSFGLCEADETTAGALTIRTAVQQGAMVGQTVTSASGDAGAADCDGDVPTIPSVATKGLAVDVPAAIPEVTGVGGTEFSGDVSNPNTYWNPTNDQFGGSAIKTVAPIPEMGWNDSPTTGTKLSATLAAGGGGKSTFYNIQSFQNSVSGVVGTARGVPDIALNASADHDGYLICSQGSCTNGGFSNGTSILVAGGTSVGAPTFAGVLAIINQGTNSNGLGPVNATLYNLATSNPNAFRDITAGSNIVPCQSGTPTTAPVALRCPTTAPFQIGYMAGSGYDLATGLGSIDANVLVTSWPGFGPVPNFALPTPSPITIANPGGSGLSTVTVMPEFGFTGTVNLTCALTPANPSAEITCGFTAPTSGSTTSVTISSSSATATLSVSTMAPHALSASSRQSRDFELLAASEGTLFAGIVMVGVPRRRRFSTLLGLVMVAFFAIGMGCGGGSRSSTPPPLTGGTPKGTYTIVVTATNSLGGRPSHPTNVTVNVQ